MISGVTLGCDLHREKRFLVPERASLKPGKKWEWSMFSAIDLDVMSQFCTSLSDGKK